MNKKQTFIRHQNTERMPEAILKILNITSYTIELNKAIANKNNVMSVSQEIKSS